MPAKSRDDIIAVAAEVFARHGFKRTTMADLAEAAGMSRPALYLVFASKEEAFVAVVEQHMARALDEIRAAWLGLASPRGKLGLALEIWLVRPFLAVNSSPNARDLYESSFHFAKEAIARDRARFVALLAEVLEPLASAAESRSDGRALAQMLLDAAAGLKHASTDADGLRGQLDLLISVVLAGLGVESLQRRETRS